MFEKKIKSYMATAHSFVNSYSFQLFKINYINTSSIHLIFKSTSRFMRFTLDLTNSIVNLKLVCMECVGDVCV
jgi:hypothetical protein